MLDVERTTNWQQIRQGVKEAERLIVRKEYNPVMVRARQVLEYVVRCMVKGTCMVEGDPSDAIDQLYEGQWINKATKDNYYTIRMLGNKAVYEGDDTAYDANQAFQLLTQEACMFANEFAGSSGDRPARISSATRNTSGRLISRQRTGGGKSASGRNSQRVPARNTHSGSSHQGGPRKKRRRVSPATCILRLPTLVLLVILLIVAIRAFMSGKGRDTDKTATVPTVITAPVEPVPTLPPEPKTESETKPPAKTYRVKGSSVNVCSEPSTSGRILIQLGGDTEVVYVKRCDNDWVVINYDGRETYVSSKYIEKVESVVSTGGETEGSEVQAANQAHVFVEVVQERLVILDVKRERT